MQMTQHNNSSDQTILRVAGLSANKPNRFDITPGQAALARMANDLGILGIRKLGFRGVVRSIGARDWALEGDLGATVVQPCIVTLAPVTTRIEQPVIRRFVDGMTYALEDEEIEMPDDDTTEPLMPEIDLMQVLHESLALALPDYPRSDGAKLGEAVFAEPGTTPLVDDDLRPFAGLADLRQRLQGTGTPKDDSPEDKN